MFLSGPMTGIEDYNFPLFDRVAKELEDKGVEVVNPARICRKFKRESVLSSKEVFNKMIDEQQVAEMECNAILLLPGWENSKGVRLELKTALNLGLEIYLYE